MGWVESVAPVIGGAVPAIGSAIIAWASVQSSKRSAEESRRSTAATIEATRQVAAENRRNHHEDQVTDAAVDTVGCIDRENKAMGDLYVRMVVFGKGKTLEELQAMWDFHKDSYYDATQGTTVALTRLQIVVPRQLARDAKALEQHALGHRKAFGEYLSFVMSNEGVRNPNARERPEMSPEYAREFNAFAKKVRDYRITTRNLPASKGAASLDSLADLGLQVRTQD